MSDQGEQANYQKDLKEAVRHLKHKELRSAETCIEKAMALNPHAPEAHNLMGILEELAGNDSLAEKHYRAAYALDATYKPAVRNLDRITSFPRNSASTDYDYGDHLEAEEPLSSDVEYDNRNIGHVVKRRHPNEE